MKKLKFIYIPAIFGVLSILLGGAAPSHDVGLIQSSPKNAGYQPGIPHISSPVGKDAYYASINKNAKGLDLIAQFRDLTVSSHVNYLNWNDLGDDMGYMETDYDPNNADNYCIDIYSRESLKGVPYKGSNIQREHIWCASLSEGLWNREEAQGPVDEHKGGGSDIHHIRPLYSSYNQSRGNNKYTEYPDDGKKVGRTAGSNPTVFGFEHPNKVSDTFEPLDAAKGDVARIILYLFMHYNTPQTLANNMPTPVTTPIGNPNIVPHGIESGKEQTYNSGNLPLTSVITMSSTTTTSIPETNLECMKLLKRWNELDPVDEIDINRNEGAYKIQGNRNPFIDYPELVNVFLDTTLGLNSTEDGNTGPDQGGGNEGGGDNPPTPTKELTSITVTAPETIPYYGTFETNSIKVTGTYSDNTTQDLTYNPGTTITQNIDTKQIGTYEISATHAGKSASTTLKVTNIGAHQTGSKDSVTTISAASNNKFTSWGGQNTGAGDKWTVEKDITADTTLKANQFGKSAVPIGELTFTSQSNYENKTINKVVVEARGASTTKNAKVSVTVGGTPYTTTDNNLTSTQKAFTFTGNSKGVVVVKLTQNIAESESAFYLYSLTVGTAITLFTPQEQVLSFARYFNTLTAKACKGNEANWQAFSEAIPAEKWDEMKLEYNAMSNEAKAEFKNPKANSEVVDACTRYTYCVNKYKNLNDFAGLSNKSTAPNQDFVTPTMIIIIVVAIALIAVSVIAIIVLEQKSKLFH